MARKQKKEINSLFDYETDNQPASPGARRAKRIVDTVSSKLIETSDPADTKAAGGSNHNNQRMWQALGRKERIGVVAIGLMLTIGALGATGLGSRIIETFSSLNSPSNAGARLNQRNNSQSSSALNSSAVEPMPLPPGTAQLSKEYVYAGSRMLAVEDAAPPADLAVWRPSTGYWYVLGGPGSQQTIAQWGMQGDIPVPGDYDGDGKTDFCIYRPTTATWYIYKSSDGTMLNYNFGNSDDIPKAADFDGDGKSDAALYRPSTGYWYVLQSSTSTLVSGQLGGSPGDVPYPADFDGDGRADYAVFRSGTWYVLKSSTGQTAVDSFGQTGDVPVPGDYDGDGKADYAVRRGNDWYVLKSSNGQTVITSPFGLAGDKEVTNDYDGDGKLDIAVWRNSNGTWYILNSSNGQTRIVQWGISGDFPVPAFYHR